MVAEATIPAPELEFRKKSQRMRIRTCYDPQTPHLVTISSACWDRQRDSLGCRHRDIGTHLSSLVSSSSKSFKESIQNDHSQADEPKLH